MRERSTVLLSCAAAALALLATGPGGPGSRRHSETPVGSTTLASAARFAPVHEALRAESDGRDGLPAGPQSMTRADRETLLERVAEDTYAFRRRSSDSETAYRAYNREHALTFTLDGGGVHVRSAVAADADWGWSMRLVGFGYAGQVTAVGEEIPVRAGNRVEYRRDALVEWYINEPRGLEQGFTVASRPASVPPVSVGAGRSTSPLVLELRTTGLDTRQDIAGKSVVATTPAGNEVLQYRGLVAWDSEGIDVPATLWATDTGIRIEVDDHGASYPLTIDPFVQRRILRAADAQIDDNFGISAAVSGDTAIVAAWFEDGGPGDPLSLAGAAYVFERNHGGVDNWGEVAKLTASDAAADSWYGVSVAIDGDTAVVGAYLADQGPGGPLDSAGSAYVYERNHGGPGNWGEVKILTASDRQALDNFGVAVDIDGDTMAIGAYSEEGGAGDPRPRAGAVYLYERNHGGPGNWGETKKLTSSDTQMDDRFGNSVAIEGDTLVAGAFYEAGPYIPLSQTGAAYVFGRNHGGAGNWGEIKKLTASDTEQFDRFGVDVAISGSTVLIGSYLESGGPGGPVFQSGAAYVFERDHGGADNWGELRKLTASDAQIGDQFGISVAIEGDIAIVGADMEDGGFGDPLPGAGATYVFERSSGGFGAWGETSKITAWDAQTDDGFGEVVALEGGTAVVGARFEDGGPGDPISGAGAAYVFDRTNWAYVLDAFGGVHAIGSGVVKMSPPPPYFGFDVARDLELTSDGGYVLDGFGGVHRAGSGPDLSPGPPYFGFDIIQDLELTPAGNGYVLDGFGGVHAVGGAPVISPAAPYFGFDVARDMELGNGGYYVLDGFGGLHAAGGAPAIAPGPPYFGFDVSQDLELAPGGGYALDGFGGVHVLGSAPVLSPAAPYFGFDVARDFELEPGGGYYVLDGFGGFHPAAGAPQISPEPPYFGFDAARDFEIR